MEEKKLTDEEIIKALDICTTADDDMDCIDGCPMYEEDYCTTKLLKMAFDLIHRLLNEKLIYERDSARNAVDEWVHKYSEQKAEIERLTTRCEIAEGTKNRLTIFDRIKIHDKAVKDTAKECYELFKFYKKHYYDIPLDLVARDIKEKTGVEVE